jgi:hypothetical protein
LDPTEAAEAKEPIVARHLWAEGVFLCSVNHVADGRKVLLSASVVAKSLGDERLAATIAGLIRDIDKSRAVLPT